MTVGTSVDAKQFGEAVRRAFLEAVLESYEGAAPRCSCHEGAWEAALSAIQRLDLDEILGQPAGKNGQAPRCELSALQVREVMTPEAATLRPQDELSIAEDVMRLGRIRHLPVVDESGSLCGIVSQRDLLRKALLGLGNQPAQQLGLEAVRVSDVMTSEVVATTPEESLRDAATKMFRRKLGCLPVVHGGKVVGIVTEADFVRLAL